MIIKILGGTKKMRTEIDQAARFYGHILLHGKTFKNIYLDIVLMKKLDVLGECIDEEDCARPRMFTINLRNGVDDTPGSDSDPFRTLAHEMVHLKQHAIGDLRSGVMVPTRGGLKMSSKWQGKLWSPSSKEHAYYDSPWEVEAYGREVGLYQRWVASREKS